MKLLKYSLLPVAACASALATPAYAEAGDTFVRVRAIMVAPTESSGGILRTFPTEEVKVNNSIMPEIDITHMVSNNVGLELIAATTKHNASGITGTRWPSTRSSRVTAYTDRAEGAAVELVLYYTPPWASSLKALRNLEANLADLHARQIRK